MPSRRRLADAVVEDLVKDIVTEVYPSHSVLPIESALCEKYDVSRTVIREATTALTGKGLISTEQGRGTIVKDISHWVLLDPIVLSALFQRDDGLKYLDSLIEIRTTLESAMAAKAAQNITLEQKAELTRQFETLEKLVKDHTAYKLEDLKFHNLIMTASGDILSQAIIASVQSKALETFHYSGKEGVGHFKRTHTAHRQVFEAILQRDAEGASRAMREHIEVSWRERRPSASLKKR